MIHIKLLVVTVLQRVPRSSKNLRHSERFKTFLLDVLFWINYAMLMNSNEADIFSGGKFLPF